MIEQRTVQSGFFRRFLAVMFCGLLLAGCAGERPAVDYRSVPFSALPGWYEDDLRDFPAAMRRSCAKPQEKPAWREACAALPARDADIRAYLETYFQPWQIVTDAGDMGLFTGYYVPELRASRLRQGRYQTPIYGMPRDFLLADLGAFKPEWRGQRLTGRVEGNRFAPYPARAAIAQKGVDAPVLAWAADPVDVFFLHIQGSGRLCFPDGSSREIGYAAQNGRPYVAIGKVLKDEGAFPDGMVTMQRIRAWLDAHPQERARILNSNPSYVFFKPLSGVAQGAQGVELTPLRSLAVDRRYIPLGAPVWLDAEHPEGGALQRLLVAQDTGGAIKGAIRGDVYWGYGVRAAERAGVMQSRGRAYLLLPHGLAPEGRG